MKLSLLFCMVSIGLAGCSDFDTGSQNSNGRISDRSTIDHLYFHDGLGTGVYSAVLQEYQIVMLDDYEFKPHGSSNWLSIAGGTKVRVRCKCYDSCTGGSCNGYVTYSNPIEYGCTNECTGTECGCDMRVRITGANDNTTIYEYASGGDIRDVP